MSVAGGELDLKTTGTTVLQPDIYGDVRVDGGTLVVSGGIYRFRSLRADANTVIEIHLAAGETIVFQVERDVDLGKGVEMRIVGSGSPDDVLVLVAESKVDLGENGTYVGTFVADDGDARLGRKATLVGALYGRGVHIDDGATLTLDPATWLYASQSIPNQYDTRNESGGASGPQPS